MNCLFPRFLSVHGKEVAVPCGKCINCRVERTREWATRLYHESLYSDSAYFVTLTYDEESEPWDNNGNPMVSKDDVQKFFKRLRKQYPESGIRYFLGSEYGPETGRPHYHAIIYNLPSDVLSPSVKCDSSTLLIKYIKGFPSMINRKLNDIWGKGFTTIGELTQQRINYCAKYFVHKIECDEIQEKNFNLMSRRPGIGFNYQANVAVKVHSYNLHTCFAQNGKYVKLPRYYDKKIFTDDERKKRLQSYEMPLGLLEIRNMSQEEAILKGVEKEHLILSRLRFENPSRKV